MNNIQHTKTSFSVYLEFLGKVKLINKKSLISKHEPFKLFKNSKIQGRKLLKNIYIHTYWKVKLC